MWYLKSRSTVFMGLHIKVSNQEWLSLWLTGNTQRIYKTISGLLYLSVCLSVYFGGHPSGHMLGRHLSLPGTEKHKQRDLRDHVSAGLKSIPLSNQLLVVQGPLPTTYIKWSQPAVAEMGSLVFSLLSGNTQYLFFTNPLQLILAVLPIAAAQYPSPPDRGPPNSACRRKTH